MSEALVAADAILSDWRAENPETVAFAETTGDGGDIAVSVITEAQRARFLAQYPPSLPTPDIAVLARPERPPALGFQVLLRDSASLLRTPDEGGALTTDLDRRDGVMRGLAVRNSHMLVQLQDATLGWIPMDEIERLSPGQEWSRFLTNENDLPNGSSESAQRIVDEARTYLGTPYVLGGRSRERMDCSGLTSRVYRDVLDWILPRHSTDQRRHGIRTPSSDVQPGDLLFARLGKTRVPHVGIVTAREGERFSILHASQRAREVIEESHTAFFAGYGFMGAKRLLPEAPKP